MFISMYIYYSWSQAGQGHSSFPISSTIFWGSLQASATYLFKSVSCLNGNKPKDTYLVWLPLATISPLTLVNLIDVNARFLPTVGGCQ